MQKERHTWKPVIFRGMQTGKIRDDNLVYLKPVYNSHYFQKYQAVGISKEVLDRLKTDGVKQIKIVRILDNRNVTYKSSIEQWYSKGINHINEEDMTDEQILLKMSDMICQDDLQ